MAFRNYPIHTVSVSQPSGGNTGDEWFNPTTNKLYKLMVVNGSFQWSEIFNANATSGINLPTGTTAQRPTNPVNGQLRINSELNQVEMYASTRWLTISNSYAINYVAVAGGGAGGWGSGGGAGGVLYDTSLLNTTVYSGQRYTVTIGAGGTSARVAGVGFLGNNCGSDSSIVAPTGPIAVAYGGGGGGTDYTGGGGGYVSNATAYKGSNGGSGGGTGGNATATGIVVSGGSGVYLGSTYKNLQRQGYDGGACSNVGNSPSGGGGGAGAKGGDSGATTGGAGGIGIPNPITGSTVGQLVSTTYYLGGGGGGGGYASITPGTGGSGGGGNGTVSSTAAGSGLANTGGGGGGNGATGDIGSGGSGVVVISYTGLVQRATGGTVTTTTIGGVQYWIHTFTTSGIFSA